MVLWCVVGLMSLLFLLPLRSRIQIRGSDPIALDVRLLFGPIPLWKWTVHADAEHGIQSRVCAFVFPVKSTLPAFLQRHKKKSQKHSAFALDLHLEKLFFYLDIPWDGGWETLRMVSFQQLVAFFVQQGLSVRNTKTDIRVQLRNSETGIRFQGEALVRMHLIRTIIRTIRKAVKRRWNTQLKN